MTLLLALLLIVLVLAAWATNLLGMPGNWLIVAATALYAYLTPAAIGWKTVVILVALAALGEIVELLASAAGAARAGGSKRGAALALLGSIGGGLFGLLVGLPIPLVGPIVAALFFAALGAMTGAILGETWAGQQMGESWRIGQAAFWARLVGTLGKVLVGAVMVATVIVALVL